MITNAGKILYTPPANENNRVLLKVMPDTGDVSRNLYPISKADTSHFSESRVRLLGRDGIYARTNPSPLRVLLKSRSGGAGALILAPVPYELLYAWQNDLTPFMLTLSILHKINFKMRYVTSRTKAE